MLSVLSLVGALTLSGSALAQTQPTDVSYNGLGLTPAMGWNSWNTFACNIDETTILTAAQQLVSSGLRDLGYNYVVIDDCWQADKRADDGAPVANPVKFPSGMKNLTASIEAMGLKAGIYSSAGTYTCGLHFGSLDYEEIDAKTYAEWGFSYLKLDNCFNRGEEGNSHLSYTRYKKMSDALLKYSKSTVLSLCSWGEDRVWMWANAIANSYRMSGDIHDSFTKDTSSCPFDSKYATEPAGFGCSVANILEKSVMILQKQVRGSWADLDMLEVGRGGMTTDEYIVHFTMWAAVKSPLILGNDLSVMDNVTLAILSNKGVIGVSQNPDGGAGSASRIYGERGGVQLWAGTGQNSTVFLGLVNFSDKNETVTIDLSDIGALKGTKATAVDLWGPDFFPQEFVPQGFGNNAIPETIEQEIAGVEVRAQAGRFWLLSTAQ